MVHFILFFFGFLMRRRFWDGGMHVYNKSTAAWLVECREDYRSLLYISKVLKLVWEIKDLLLFIFMF
jgi:hypothetical protein